MKPVVGQHAWRSITLTPAHVEMYSEITGDRNPSQQFRFTSPVFIGDTITAEATVQSVHREKPVTKLAVRIRRQTGEVVLEGEAWCDTVTPE